LKQYLLLNCRGDDGLKKQLAPSSKNSSKDEVTMQQTVMLEKLKFEVSQEMGLNSKENNKNS
jgi:hypothetical protein